MKPATFLITFINGLQLGSVYALIALGYDAMKIMAQAIENAGSTEKEAIVAALDATDIEGATGHMTFDDHNDPIKSVFVISFSDEGKEQLETVVNP